MSVVLALVAGFVAGRLMWVVLRPSLATSSTVAENYRGHRLPLAGGVVLASALVVIEGSRAAVAAVGPGNTIDADSARLGTLLVVLGFAFLGFVDDVAGSSDVRGFRGHLGALSKGVLTTGGLKMLVGGALSLAVADVAVDGSAIELALAAAVPALSANLANLLDLSPGRSNKFMTLAFVVVVVLALFDPALAAPAVVFGAGLAILRPDLKEHMMLGDAGAQVLGGALGLSVLVVASVSVQWTVLAGLVLFNVISEVVSFSSVISKVGFLRSFDNAGRISAK